MAMLRFRPSTASAQGPLRTALSRFGASLFFGLFLGMGLFFLVMLVDDTRDRLAPYGWEERPATIVRAEVIRGDGESPYVPIVVFEYEWNGQTRTSSRISPDDPGEDTYASAAARITDYPVGALATCRVGPDGDAVLVPGTPWIVLFIVLPLVFVAVGGGGLYLTWRPRRRDALGRPVDAPISSAAGGHHPGRAMMVFGGLFAAVGAGIAWPTAIGPALGIWRAQSWTPETCVVEHSSVRSHTSDDGTTYSIDILYRWERDGRTWRSSRYGFFGGSSSGRDGKQAIVRAHPAGEAVRCFVDPADPGEAVIDRGLGVQAFIGLIPLAFLSLGLLLARAGWRKRTIRARLRESLRTSTRGPAPDDPVLAWLPDFTPASGRTVLAPETTRATRLVGIVFACVFWNGIVSVFAHQAMQSFERGRPEWGLTLFLVPFVLVGIGLCFGIVHAIMALTNARPILAASASTLMPGETIEVDWQLHGRLAGIRRLALTLEGVESATYRRGTDTYTAQETFASIALAETTDPRAMASGRVALAVPRDAMHSFEGGNNRIAWSLHLEGEIHRWPDIDERYAIVVLPLPRGELGKPGDG